MIGLFHEKSGNGWWLGVPLWLRKPPYACDMSGTFQSLLGSWPLSQSQVPKSLHWPWPLQVTLDTPWHGVRHAHPTRAHDCRRKNMVLIEQKDVYHQICWLIDWQSSNSFLYIFYEHGLFGCLLLWTNRDFMLSKLFVMHCWKLHSSTRHSRSCKRGQLFLVRGSSLDQRLDQTLVIFLDIQTERNLETFDTF